MSRKVYIQQETCGPVNIDGNNLLMMASSIRTKCAMTINEFEKEVQNILKSTFKNVPYDKREIDRCDDVYTNSRNNKTHYTYMVREYISWPPKQEE